MGILIIGGAEEKGVDRNVTVTLPLTLTPTLTPTPTLTLIGAIGMMRGTAG